LNHFQLRVARIDSSGLTPLAASPEALQDLHGRLDRVIRRHLPGVTASLLARPQPVPDTSQVDWYSDLAGQPAPLLSLPPEEQAAARSLLSDRLASLNKLADELQGSASEDAGIADSLRQATAYPDDSRVYAVDSEPVLTFWGYGSRQAARAAGAGAGRANRRLVPLAWLALALLLAVTAAGGWLWLGHQREQALLAALEEALSAACDPVEPLAALNAELAEVDPAGTAYPVIRRQAEAETERCEAAGRLARDIEAAAGDCEQLADIAEGLADMDLTREPFGYLHAGLLAEREICERAAGLDVRLDAAIGDCPAVTVLSEELGTPPEGATALHKLRDRLDTEMDLCGDAAQLMQELDANLGKCRELLRIDGRVAGADSSRPPLEEVRARLDSELDLCAKAERYLQALADAQTDCGALRALDANMQDEDSSREPLAAVRKRLDKALQACRSLDDLEQALQDALGDCKRLAALSKRLDEEEGLKRNPMALDVRRRVVDELQFCALVQAWEQKLAAAGGDCAALDKLKTELASGPGTDSRLGSIGTRLNAAIALCRESAVLERRLVSVGGDCSALRALRHELSARPGDRGHLAATRKRLDSALEKCDKRTIAQAPAAVSEVKSAAKTETGQPKRSKPVDTRTLCPGERPVELAPDLVIVFDASGSMSQPMSLDGKLADVLAGSGAIGAVIGGLAKMRGGETRIDVAKKATNGIVSALPNDVDVGLVLVEQCNQARPVGFFSPKQRKRLMSGVYAIQPVRGTPLASGIAKAASMVDGVKSPATIVVISDGKESCNGNPCAVAAGIAKRKPMLTINVVDIMGTGAGTCAARATGGRVFAAKNAAQLKSMLRRATAEVRGPANCRKK